MQKPMLPLRLLALSLSVTTTLASALWPQFRGPDGSGVAEGERPPVHFGPASNVVWSTTLAPGASSPCVAGDLIFLTTFADNQLETVCLSRRDGQVRWRRAAPAERIEKFHPAEGSPAASTPSTDGERVIVYFGSFGLLAYDREGQEQWRLSLPVAEQVGDFGSGGSPILVDGLVLVNRDMARGSHLLAVDARTGKVAWRAERPEFYSSFGTPVAWSANGATEIVLAGFLQMKAYDLKTGAERWRVRGLPSGVCTTPVLGEGMLFFAGWAPGKADAPFPTYDAMAATSDRNKDGVIEFEEADPMVKGLFASGDVDRDGRLTRDEWQKFLAELERGENVLLAVRPGGTGDVTETHVVWRQRRGLPYVASPLYYRGRVYLVKDGGLVSCFEARTGKPLYEQERLGALGSYYASPVAADGRIYFASLNGVVTVIRAGDQLEVLARNDLGERLMATPAIVDHTLYVRTDKRLSGFRQSAVPPTTR
jgi:outer membrane protein assembly factor BamB